MVPGSAIPVNVGVESLVLVSVVDIVGFDIDKSTEIVTELEGCETFPALSVTCTVRTLSPSGNGELGYTENSPVLISAVVVPT